MLMNGILKVLILNNFQFGGDVVVLIVVILDSFYFEMVWLYLRDWFSTVSTFGRMWWSWMFVRFHFGRSDGLKSSDFLTVSTLRQCGDLQRTDFFAIFTQERCGVFTGLILTIFTLVGCVGFQGLFFKQCIFWKSVVTDSQ